MPFEYVKVWPMTSQNTNTTIMHIMFYVEAIFTFQIGNLQDNETKSNIDLYFKYKPI